MPTITKEALTILTKPENAYWVWSDDEFTSFILVDAVDFGEDAFRLAGPFDDKYGLVYISEHPKANSFTETCNKSLASKKESTLYMPHSVRNSVEAHFGKASTFYWDKESQESYSNLDIPYLDPDFVATLESRGECSLFFTTKEAYEHIICFLTEDERIEWQKEINQAHDRQVLCMLKDTACAERPFLIRLQGSDDASWGRALSSKEEALEILEKLKTNGFKTVDSDMVFTN